MSKSKIEIKITGEGTDKSTIMLIIREALDAFGIECELLDSKIDRLHDPIKILNSIAKNTLVEIQTVQV